VRALEERLGAILIVRGQPCMATDLGRALCTHLDRVQLLEADLGPALRPRMSAPLTLKIAVNADSLATWLPQALAAFAQQTGTLLDLVLDDEAHTAERLRAGEVVAAVTADPDPAPGCKSVQLGTLWYAACASPDFMKRHFAKGVNRKSLAIAPTLRFDRRDRLQARWARRAYGITLKAPTHWAPSTGAFLDLTCAGLAWSMQPKLLARAAIAAGRLVELPPARPLGVKLYWNVLRLHAASLGALTAAVRKTAGEQLGA
jgi:LysR family transcriptional regulator (chromosome initiation inhibitor)